MDAHDWLNTPRPTLEPCPRCGRTVLVRLWIPSQRGTPQEWRELDPPLTPVFGEPHVCTQDNSAVPTD